MKHYFVHSAFLTLQGEGAWSGARCVFVRFTGCNIWSGDPKDRARDTSKGACAAWCDTEFRKTHLGDEGGKYTAEELLTLIMRLWGSVMLEDVGEPGASARVVFTGGEPFLQLDGSLLAYLKVHGVVVHVETNGSIPIPVELRSQIDWLTLSPKPPAPLAVTEADEVKVVVPAFSPGDFVHVKAKHYFVQPQDFGHPADFRTFDAIRRAKTVALVSPRWRLSLQTHKAANLP